jgi:hypothetical protein
MAQKPNEMAARFARVSRTDKPMPVTQPGTPPAQQDNGATDQTPNSTVTQRTKSTSAQPHINASAQTPKPANPYTKRLPLTLTPEAHTELLIARARDGIEATARLRAMVDLWREDAELRQRIDEKARGLRHGETSS